MKKEETGLATRQEENFELATTGAAAIARHEIESAIVIAKKFPRDEKAAFEKVMDAAERPSFAEDAAYSYPRGDATIEGPSINLAREIARAWGNIRYGLEVIRDDESSRLIRAWAWDLESNTKVSAEDDFQKLIFRKAQGNIKPDERDLRELTFRRGAILTRNCILPLVPKDMIEDILEKCKETLKKSAASNPQSTQEKLIKAFSEQEITVKMIEEYLSHKLSDSAPDEIANLRKIYKSIADGNSKKEDYFDKKKEPETGTLNMNDLKPGKEENRGHGEENLGAARTSEPKPEKNGKPKVKVPLTKKEKDFLALKIQETSQGIRDQFGEDISEEEFDDKFRELSGTHFGYFIDAEYDDVILFAGIVKERLKGLKK